MKTQNYTNLSSYMMYLLSIGRVTFTREEAQVALDVSEGAILDATERQQRKGRLISPSRSFYVIVPPQYLAWGAPPPSWYIDDLMRYGGHTYYVGLLKAAELHGATHQAVMEFQIVSGNRLPKIRAGRSAIGFYYRKDICCVKAGVVTRKTDTGVMRISSIELTLLDLLRYPQAAGGLDSIATIISDIGKNVDSQKLISLSTLFEKTVVQRLGYLLERFGLCDRLDPLHEIISLGQKLSWTELEPHMGAISLPHAIKAERNERWRVVVRRPLECDE